MDFAEFEARFRPTITVGLNWTALAQMDAAVVRREIVSAVELGQLGLPWYLDPKEQAECNFEEPRAKRITVTDAPALLSTALAQRRALIGRKADELGAEPKTTLLVYRPVGRREVLLDGCHRAVALLVLGEAFVVEVFSLLGPDDPAVFLDLAVAE